jgi:quercetin dioxygenase-like cupin family protein
MMRMDRPQAVPTQQVVNDRVIVTEWRFAPGTQTGWHIHGHDYVVVPQTDGELLLETKEGNRTSQLRAGQSYAGLKGVEHNVVNATAEEVVFVEIEIR